MHSKIAEIIAIIHYIYTQSEIDTHAMISIKNKG